MSTNCFTSHATVRFSDADPAGILFFGRIFEFAHAALESFVVDCGIGWETWFSSPVWAVPIVNAQADYKNSMKAGSQLVVDLHINKLGNSSCSFEFVFSSEQKICAIVHTTHVFIEKSSCKSLSIPEPIRSVLTRYLPAAS